MLFLAAENGHLVKKIYFSKTSLKNDLYVWSLSALKRHSIRIFLFFHKKLYNIDIERVIFDPIIVFIVNKYQHMLTSLAIIFVLSCRNLSPVNPVVLSAYAIIFSMPKFQKIHSVIGNIKRWKVKRLWKQCMGND